MKRQPRVVWTKGMFLSPQHFQVQDQHFEDLIQFRFGSSNYANYGVTDLQLDAEAVANGIVKITSARGLLFAGWQKAFDMPNSDELPPPVANSRSIGRQEPRLWMFTFLFRSGAKMPATSL